MHGVGVDMSVFPCDATALNQVWKTTTNSDGTYTFAQNGSCITNNFKEDASAVHAPFY